MASAWSTMITGEKELADQFLDLVKTVQQQHDTLEDQAAILFEMGELYLKAAISNKSGEQFMKASALFNAAVVRTSSEEKQARLNGALVNVHNEFAKMFHLRQAPLTLDGLKVKRDRSKKMLKDMRQNTNDSLQHLRSLWKIQFSEGPTEKDFNNYSPIMNESEKLSKMVKEQNLDFTRQLWERSLEDTAQEPPCQHDLLGLGSIARQEVTPYSDFEFAILIERESEEIREYFLNLTYIFALNVLDLGETPLPCVAIASLNDFMSPGGDRFYDVITPSGYKLDGLMPWACKTPFGRKATTSKEPLQLIHTPEKMAALQNVDNVLGQSYHVADILSNTVVIYGDGMLSKEYESKMDEIIGTHPEYFQRKASESIKDDYYKMIKSILSFFSEKNMVESKHTIYRLPSLFVENLRLFYMPREHMASQWQTIDKLQQSGILSQKGAFHLKLTYAIAYAYRLLTYCANQGQYEGISYLQPKEKSGGSSYSNAYVENFDILALFFHGCQAIADVTKRHFLQDDNSPNLVSETLFCYDGDLPMFSQAAISNSVCMNVEFAEQFGEIKPRTCGKACFRKLIKDFTSTNRPTEKVEIIDRMLKKRTSCKCAKLIESHLEVTMKYFKYLDSSRDAHINPRDKKSHLEKYKSCDDQGLRERSFLLMDLSLMATVAEDPSFSKEVIRLINEYLKQEKQFSGLERVLWLYMELPFKVALKRHYLEIDDPDETIRLYENEIEAINRKLGIAAVTWYLSVLHHELAKHLMETSSPKYRNKAIYHLECSVEIGKVHVQKYYSEDHQVGLGYELSKSRVIELSELYEINGDLEKAIVLLKKHFTKGDQIIKLKSDEDPEGIVKLCEYLEMKGDKPKKELYENQLYAAFLQFGEVECEIGALLSNMSSPWL